MQRLEWDDSYSVGDEHIDAQHRQLLEIINRLGALISGDVESSGVSPQGIFDELARYVTSHFAYEEQRMVDAGYPLDLVEVHRGEHRAILAQLQAFEAHMESGDQEVMRDLLPFLYGDWLINHICAVDAAYAPCLAAARVAEAGRDMR